MTLDSRNFPKSTDYNSPFRKAREALGVSRLEMARRTGKSYSSLTNAELGRPLTASPTFMEALLELGAEDVSWIPEAYAVWRRSVR